MNARTATMGAGLTGKPRLTVKQDKFARLYAKTGNGTQSAIAAGYSPNSAGSIAHENLNKPEIADEIAKHRKRTAERLDISREKLVNDAAHDAEAASIKGDWSGANASRTFIAKTLGYHVERSLNVTVDLTEAHLDALRGLANRGRGKPGTVLDHDGVEAVGLAARSFAASGASMASGDADGQEQAASPYNMHYGKR